MRPLRCLLLGCKRSKDNTTPDLSFIASGHRFKTKQDEYRGFIFTPARVTTNYGLLPDMTEALAMIENDSEISEITVENLPEARVIQNVSEFSSEGLRYLAGYIAFRYEPFAILTRQHCEYRVDEEQKHEEEEYVGDVGVHLGGLVPSPVAERPED
ncbi:hypothetical protein ANN_25425 [Periplaneta americana]|uniref:Per a allergen n=1 Tax=Periplaneta americana TaxID=6978 RepID=A0ABQ8S1N1_PERAM|nr:hypothetical protein ANN_25425 [Periplaneta americana]